MKSIYYFLLLAGIAVFVFGCKEKDNDKITPNQKNDLVKIGETYISGARTKAIVYAPKELETGYNELFISLVDSVDGSKLNDGHLTIKPIMNMGVMTHSTPVENPNTTSATDGFFKVPVVFLMAGNDSQWTLNIFFHNHKNDLEGEGKLGVNIVANTPSKILNTTLPLDSNAKAFISLIAPKEPKQGINDFEVVLHEKVGMMDFPPIENYTIEIVPEMPSMGHGSPNNVNPVHIGKGHYVGKVNFTMTGLWNIKLKLYKNGALISNDQYFEITLK